jgi:uncharacterized protein (TIGR02246 family)
MLMLIAGAPWTTGHDPGENHDEPGKEGGVISELEQLNQRWTRAWLEKDAATVERLMADDYVYVAPTGQVVDREGILRIIRSPVYRLHRWERTNVVVRMLGNDAAVIRHRGQGEGVFEGKPFTEDHACMTVCARVRGAWQIVMEQCTASQP